MQDRVHQEIEYKTEEYCTGGDLVYLLTPHASSL